MRNLKGGVCYEMAIGDVELDEGPLNIIMAYLLKATGPRELDQVIAGRVSLGHSVQAPLAADVMDAVRQRQAPQLEPRSRYSVTLRAPAKPRNPAYPQPLYPSSTGRGFGPRGTGF